MNVLEVFFEFTNEVDNIVKLNRLILGIFC